MMKPPNRTIRVAIHPVVTSVGPVQAPAAFVRSASVRQSIAPLIDIHEEPEGLVLEADLPGATFESLNVQLEDNVLSLRAEGISPVSAAARILHEEFRPGEFQRSFILSADVDRERIAAELKNGVLRLTLPKAERAKTRRIEIKSS